MKTFIKLQKLDEFDDILQEYVETPELAHISEFIETELLDDLNLGEKILLSVVEMTDDELQEFNENVGYC